MTDQPEQQPPSLPGFGRERALLPLRDVAVFPHLVITLYVGRPFSIKSLEYASKHGSEIVLVAQRNPEVETPKGEEVYDVGCLSTVIDSRPLNDGTHKVLVEGKRRVHIREVQYLEDQTLVCRAEDIEVFNKISDTPQEIALRRSLVTAFENFVRGQRKLSQELVAQAASVQELDRLVDTVVSHLPLSVADHQEFLEMSDVAARAEKLLARISQEQEISKIEKKIYGQVKKQIEKSHREFYLNEQVKAIQKELGDDPRNELDELKSRAENAGMSKRAKEKCLQELKKLSLMPMMSAEATVVRNYVDTLLSFPWKKRAKTNPDLVKAERQLASDHHGLEKVKERILEYLAVQRRAKRAKSPVLCFVGPPGVGKTSLGRSIAKATERDFVRISLGGVRDEAEIRGHRRTYIGSMPGKVMQGLVRAGTKNPVFLFDEIDKMGMDFRGDPAAALLEVLDHEQNHNFSDHYAEVGFDLSEVLFITTSNTLNIPPALADRLEVIPLSGYTENEKMEIARRHLIPKQLEQNGLEEGDLEIANDALLTAIRYYTREAGVRELERAISKICRKIVIDIERKAPKGRKAPAKGKKAKAKAKAGKPEAAEAAAPGDGTAPGADAPKPGEAEAKPEEAAPEKTKVSPRKKVVIGVKRAEKLLGVRQHKFGRANQEDKVGQVTGLAWTNVGGDLLSIEVAKFKGSGKIVRTGKLGEVMRESITAAVSVMRSRAKGLGIAESFHRNEDIHVHLPEGAIPKDGPSAGIGIVTALVSVFTGIPVRADTAMTGEITLRGEVLQVGGLKEKLLAAHRGGISRVILPEENRKDMEEVPEEIQKGLEFFWVRWIDEVLNIALTEIPSPKRGTKRRSKSAKPPVPPKDKGKEPFQEPVTH